MNRFTDRRAALQRLAAFSTLAAAGSLASFAARAQTASAVAEAKKRGRLIIGIQAANPPWGFVDATTGQADGLDADMGKAFAQDLGVRAEFMGLEVANRIPALTSGRVDILFATMGMLPDRAKAVQFSKPYVANVISLVAAKTTVVKTAADMARLTIGVPRASVQDTQVTQQAPAGTNILRFDNDAATIQALLSGQVQAVGGNLFYVKRLNEQRPGMFENKLEFTRLFNGACSRLGDKETNAALNAFIDKITANGELAKIHTKWTGSADLKFPASIEGIPFVAA